MLFLLLGILVSVLQRNRTNRVTSVDLSLPSSPPSLHPSLPPYLRGIYQSGLQAVVQLVQQWQSTNNESKRPVVALSVRLHVSCDIQYTPESQRSRLFCQGRNRLASKSKEKQATSKSFLLPCPLDRLLPEKCGSGLKVGLSISNDLIKKNYSQFASVLVNSIYIYDYQEQSHISNKILHQYLKYRES